MQEERSPQARSLEAFRKSFHRVSGQSNGRLHFPVSGKKESATFNLQSSALNAPARASTEKQGQGSLVPNVTTPKPFQGSQGTLLT